MNHSSVREVVTFAAVFEIYVNSSITVTADISVKNNNVCYCKLLAYNFCIGIVSKCFSIFFLNCKVDLLGTVLALVVKTCFLIVLEESIIICSGEVYVKIVAGSTVSDIYGITGNEIKDSLGISSLISSCILGKILRIVLSFSCDTEIIDTFGDVCTVSNGSVLDSSLRKPCRISPEKETVSELYISVGSASYAVGTCAALITVDMIDTPSAEQISTRITQNLQTQTGSIR